MAGDYTNDQEVAGALRERRRVNAESESGEKKEGIMGNMMTVATAPVRKVTNKWLVGAWLSMVSVVAFLFSVLYIDLHWLGSVVFGKKVFCEPGDEWWPARINHGLEKGIIILCNIIILLCVGGVIAFFVIIVQLGDILPFHDKPMVPLSGGAWGG